MAEVVVFLFKVKLVKGGLEKILTVLGLTLRDDSQNTASSPRNGKQYWLYTAAKKAWSLLYKCWTITG
jgi:hypothetical protein